MGGSPRDTIQLSRGLRTEKRYRGPRNDVQIHQTEFLLERKRTDNKETTVIAGWKTREGKGNTGRKSGMTRIHTHSLSLFFSFFLSLSRERRFLSEALGEAVATVARRRAARITAPRVSRNPGLYASVAFEAHDSGASRHFYVFSASERAGADSSRQARQPGGTSPSSSEADVRAGALTGLVRPRRGTSFSRLRRGQAVRAPTPCGYCAGTIPRGPPPPTPLRRGLSPLSPSRNAQPRFYSDSPSFIVSARYPVISARGDADRSLLLAIHRSRPDGFRFVGAVGHFFSTSRDQSLTARGPS